MKKNVKKNIEFVEEGVRMDLYGVIQKICGVGDEIFKE